MLWIRLEYAEQMLPRAIAIALANGTNTSLQIIMGRIHGTFSSPAQQLTQPVV